MMTQPIQWPPLRSEDRVDLCAEAAFGLLAMKGKTQVQVGALEIRGQLTPTPSLNVYDGGQLVLSGESAAGVPFSASPRLHCHPQPGANNWQTRLVAAHNRALGMP